MPSNVMSPDPDVNDSIVLFNRQPSLHKVRDVDAFFVLAIAYVLPS
jgi:hypothetical protein